MNANGAKPLQKVHNEIPCSQHNTNVIPLHHNLNYPIPDGTRTAVQWDI